MIYRLVVLSDEIDLFFREIMISSDATFLSLQNAILESVGYSKDQITSFFICESNWEKKQEVTLLEMDTNSEDDCFLMENTLLDEFIIDSKDRLILTYDILADRSFFIEVQELQSGHIPLPICTLSKGDAPDQLMNEDEFLSADVKANTKIENIEDFYGDSEYNLDELDEEGFGGMSIDDLDERYI